MATVKINVNTDVETKEQAQALLHEIGLDMTTAINIYLKRIIIEKGIPFELSTRATNKATLSAMEELSHMEKNPSAYKGYKSIAELKEALGV